MPHINWKSVSYIINYYLTQWTDNRMPDKRGNRGSTVLFYAKMLKETRNKAFLSHFYHWWHFDWEEPGPPGYAYASKLG